MNLEHLATTDNAKHRPVRGVIYDLDGTLVDSALDFAAMRAEMQLPAGTAILEAIEQMPPPRQAECEAILHRHEAAGASGAALLPGVKELLNEGASRGWRQAVLTRNRAHLAAAVLARLSLDVHFDPVIAREHGPAKPDPWAVRHICQLWNLSPTEVVVIGDYHFDIEAGRRAGAHTVLVGPLALACEVAENELRRPDLCLSSLAEFSQLLAWVAGIGLGPADASC